MLAHAGLSFTDVALSIGTVGGHDAHSGEIESLRRRLRLAETDLASCRRAIDGYKVMVKELQSQVASANPRGKEVNLRRPLERHSVPAGTRNTSRVTGSGIGPLHSDVPQSGHTHRATVCPLSAVRWNDRGWVPARWKASAATTIAIENALPVRRWHSVQWQI
jgi:hypothetical protein